MGCDGGTIPRRDELVRLKKKPETVNIISSKFFSKGNFFFPCFLNIKSMKNFHIFLERQRC